MSFAPASAPKSAPTSVSTHPRRRRAPLALALCTAGLLAVTTSAWADQTNGYGVGTSARVNDPYPFIWATSAYRSQGDSSGNYTQVADVAPVLSDPCPGIAGSGFTCLASLGGTSGPGYNLTASTSQAALTTSFVAGSSDLLSSSAMSRADLASGQLGVEVATGYRHGALAFAGFNETLTFQVAGASASTVSHITVGLTLAGALDAPIGLATIQSSLRFGNAFAQIDHADYGQLFGDTQSTSVDDGGWVSAAWGSTTSGLTQFTGIYALTGANAVVGITNRLIGFAGNHQASALYGNAATLQLTLPQDVTYTSASGVFLTSAVPEPATSALWALGLGGVALLARRRRVGGGARSLQWAHDRCAAPAHCP